MSELLAGYFGDPDDPDIPSRSFRLIMNAVFDSDMIHESVDRDVFFRAIRDTSGVNVSEVHIQTHTVDGRQVDREVRVVYRNGLFKSASVKAHGEEVAVHRLSDALNHIYLPGGE